MVEQEGRRKERDVGGREEEGEREGFRRRKKKEDNKKRKQEKRHGHSPLDKKWHVPERGRERMLRK